MVSHQQGPSMLARSTPLSATALRGPLIASAAGVLVLAVALASESGALTRHMATHVVLMNALAPGLALALLARAPRLGQATAATLVLSTLAQLAVLWMVHAPALLHLAATRPAAAIIVQALLLLTALWFWISVLAQPAGQLWRALGALLITGKLFCLLGALLIFAGHPLAGHAQDAAGTLADQQAAGLLMVVACPLSYVLAGVILTAHWLRGLQRRDNAAAPDMADRA